MMAFVDEEIPVTLRPLYASSPALCHLFSAYKDQVSGLIALAHALAEAYKLGHVEGLKEGLKNADAKGV